jgi:hypothetical protein
MLADVAARLCRDVCCSYPRDAQRGVLSAKGASLARSMSTFFIGKDKKYLCLMNDSVGEIGLDVHTGGEGVVAEEPERNARSRTP